VISAPGYVTDERRVIAVESALVALDVGLTEQPAKLLVIAPDGAVLNVDGRVQGTCPFPKPLELSPGEHLVTFTRSGYVTWSAEQQLTRGRTVTVVAPMPRTTQRTASLILFGAAASAVTASAVFTYFALQQESSAKAFLAQRNKSDLSPAALTEYNDVRDNRNNLLVGTLATGGIGLGFAVLGAFLFAYDNQSTPKPVAKNESSRRLWVNPSRERAPAFVTATPQLSPGFTGLSLSGAF
jgi:hypothetical protein